MSNELTLKTKCYLTTQVGTQVTRKSTKTEWETYGEILRRVDEAKQWAIGDWLVDGKRHYGDGLYKRAAEITGQAEGTLRQYVHLSSQFELLARTNNLSYRHHYEVASIKLITEFDDGMVELSSDPDHNKIAELLKEAEKQGWSVVDLRKQVVAYKEWQRRYIAAKNGGEKAQFAPSPPRKQDAEPDTTDEPILDDVFGPTTDEPPAKPGPTQPPKKYDRSSYLRQWSQAIGPVRRLVDSIARGVDEMHSPLHEQVKTHLESATETVETWME